MVDGTGENDGESAYAISGGGGWKRKMPRNDNKFAYAKLWRSLTAFMKYCCGRGKGDVCNRAQCDVGRAMLV